MKSKRSIARLQRRTYRCHIKFKKRNKHRQSRRHIKFKKRLCLFISKSLIVIIYVDDVLIHGKSDNEINELIERLKQDDIALRHEGTAEGYLGVDIQWDGNQITLLQEGLTKQIITALGLDSKYSTRVNTPAETAALGRDVEGEGASGSINYAVLLECSYILDTVDQISCSRHINVHDILTL
jgi:hypothetical protein